MNWKKVCICVLSALVLSSLVQARDMTLELQMPNRMISPGVTFALDLKITNTGGDYSNAQVFVIFTTGLGDYWFYPSWCNYSEGVDWLDVDIQGNSTKEINIIRPFTWPQNIENFDGAIFLSVVLWNGELVSNISEITFCVCAEEATPTATPTPQPAVSFVYIPPGSFLMGTYCTDLCHGTNEDPAHLVTLTHGFYMQTTEVTQKQWVEIFGNNSSAYKDEDIPINRVTWYDCCVFCNRLSLVEGLTPCYYKDQYFSILFDGTPPVTSGPVYWKHDADGYRLPTEAEWEYACRAGTDTSYYNGTNSLSCSEEDSNLDPIAWYIVNSGNVLHPVGLKQPNAWGLYDMSGNINEWCWDLYDSEYYFTLPFLDPTGPQDGYRRVIRGGSFRSYASNCRSGNRGYEEPEYRSRLNGFRIVKSAD